MIIDCHGHYTTAPKALEDWRNQQIAGIKDPARSPGSSDLKISDDELRETIESQPAAADEGARQRPDDLQPARQLHGPPHRRLRGQSAPGRRSATSCATASAELFPDHFIPAAMLPQSPGVDPATCIPELVKCVEQYGNVGINLNPDPSGGHWTSPAADRPALVPDLREDGRVRHPGDDPRQHQLQRLLPHHRRALPERRHHGLHAVPDRATCSRTSRRCASSSRTAAARCPTTGGASAAWRRS